MAFGGLRVTLLRQKPGGAEIPVALGDSAEVAVDEAFSLIFVAFNTFFGLLTQEDQLRSCSFQTEASSFIR